MISSSGGLWDAYGLAGVLECHSSRLQRFKRLAHLALLLLLLVLLYISFLFVLATLPKLPNISPPKQIVLDENVPNRTIVNLLVVDYLLDGLAVNDMVVNNRDPLGCIYHGKVAAPAFFVAEERLPILLRITATTAKPNTTTTTTSNLTTTPLINLHNGLNILGCRS